MRELQIANAIRIKRGRWHEILLALSGLYLAVRYSIPLLTSRLGPHRIAAPQGTVGTTTSDRCLGQIQLSGRRCGLWVTFARCTCGGDGR